MCHGSPLIGTGTTSIVQVGQTGDMNMTRCSNVFLERERERERERSITQLTAQFFCYKIGKGKLNTHIFPSLYYNDHL
jgi:hypothetical protein